MAKMKMGPYLPEEVEAISAVPNDNKAYGKLGKVAKKLNRPHMNVYAKFKALIAAGKKSAKKKMKPRVKIGLNLDTSGSMKSYKLEDLKNIIMEDVPAMQFKVEKGDILSRVTSAEKLSMMKGLDLIVPTAIVGVRKGAILMSNSVKNAAVAYLHKRFPAQKFGATPVLDKTGKPTDEWRIFRKL